VTPLLPIALLALSLLGCPRQPDAPEPGDGVACEQLEDCNDPSLTCGLLTVCVDGFCEDAPSLVRPCPDEGQPIPVVWTLIASPSPIGAVNSMMRGSSGVPVTSKVPMYRRLPGPNSGPR